MNEDQNNIVQVQKARKETLPWDKNNSSLLGFISSLNEVDQRSVQAGLDQSVVQEKGIEEALKKHLFLKAMSSSESLEYVHTLENKYELAKRFGVCLVDEKRKAYLIQDLVDKIIKHPWKLADVEILRIFSSEKFKGLIKFWMLSVPESKIKEEILSLGKIDAFRKFLVEQNNDRGWFEIPELVRTSYDLPRTLALNEKEAKEAQQLFGRFNFISANLVRLVLNNWESLEEKAQKKLSTQVSKLSYWMNAIYKGYQSTFPKEALELERKIRESLISGDYSRSIEAQPLVGHKCIIRTCDMNPALQGITGSIKEIIQIAGFTYYDLIDENENSIAIVSDDAIELIGPTYAQAIGKSKAIKQPVRFEKDDAKEKVVKLRKQLEFGSTYSLPKLTEDSKGQLCF